MEARKNGGQIYVCPMHVDVRQPGPGQCPKCGMALVPEGSPFGLLRHMASNPLHFIIMGGVMIAVMVAAALIRSIHLCMKRECPA